MWGEIRKNQCATLWCDGLVDDESSKSNKSGRKRKCAASDKESDDKATSSQSIKTQKKKKITEVVDVDSLKSKHRTKCTVLQLRILAELVSSGLYTSTEESPCNNSMLQRAGGGSSKIKVSLALTKFSLVLQKQYQYHLVSLSSPARLIDS